MDQFIAIQIEFNMTITGFLREQTMSIPLDIKTEIHKKFMDYKWSNQGIKNCTHNQFRDISVICCQPIWVRIDIERLLQVLQDVVMDEMTRKAGCLMMQNKNI